MLASICCGNSVRSLSIATRPVLRRSYDLKVLTHMVLVCGEHENDVHLRILDELRAVRAAKLRVSVACPVQFRVPSTDMLLYVFSVPNLVAQCCKRPGETSQRAVTL